MAWGLRLWDWRPGIPLGLDGDNASTALWVRTISDFGIYAENLDVGAPFGFNRGWYPTADDVHYVLLWLLGLATESPFTTVALYFFVGFPLASLTMYWLARTESLSVPSSVMVAVLFAVLPGHFFQYPHLFLAAYWSLPLSMWLVLRVLRGSSVWRQRGQPASGHGTSMAPRLFAARTLAIVMVSALSGVYYAAFTLILLACAIAFRAIAGYDRRRLYAGLGLMAALGGVTVLSLVHQYLATRSDVRTSDVGTARSPAEGYALGGTVIDLFMPSLHHRIEPLATLTATYERLTDSTFEPASIGLISVAGLVAMAVFVIRRLLRRTRLSLENPLAVYAVLTLTALAFYTRGGLGAMFSLYVTPQIRTWTRFNVVIALFGLLAVGWVVDWLVRRRPHISVPLVAFIVLVVGVADQTNPDAAPAYHDQARAVTTLSEFDRALQRDLPVGCMVFQLPVVPFPEQPAVYDLKDYDLLLPYLSSHGLRWSFGAMKGTDRADWQLALPPSSDPQFVERVAAAGFCAVVVDEAGYPHEKSPSQALRTALGAPLATSSDGRLNAFDLRSARTSLQEQRGADAVADLGQRVLHPLSVVAYSANPDASLEHLPIVDGVSFKVGNMTDRAVPVTLSFRVTAEAVDPATPFGVSEPPQPERRLSVDISDGGQTTYDVPVGQSRDLSITFTAPVGATSLRVSVVNGPTSLPMTATADLPRVTLSHVTVDSSDDTLTGASIRQSP